MKNRYIFLLATLVALTAGCTKDLNEASVEFSNAESDKILNSSEFGSKGSILVRFNAEAEQRLASRAALSGATRSGVSEVDILLDEVGGYSVEPIFNITEANRHKVMEMGLHLWYEIRFDNGADLDAVAKRLAKVGEVERIQFNEPVKRVYSESSLRGNNMAPIVVNENIASRAATNIPFADNYTQYLWGLLNKGTGSEVRPYNGYAAVEGGDVNAIPAWKICTGDPSIVVAVVDEGVMYSHEDIVDNFILNTAEENGTIGVDDDRNGYVDDIYGYNFVGTPSSKIGWTKLGNTGHGTHVAGIVTGVNNNRIGISSIAGGSGSKDGVRVFSAQIFDGQDGSSTANTAKAIQYSADRGAHILQCSWGYTAGAVNNDREYRNAVRVEADAITYFTKYGGTEDGPIDGGLAIFAAGNDFTAIPGYPGAFKDVICVTSFGPTLKPAYYTNYGPGSDIGAPGGDMLWSYGGILSSVPLQHSTLTTNTGQKIPYDFFQGTSMACPMVSGVAALGLSYAKKLGKRYTTEEFRSMLLSASNNCESHFTGSVTVTDDYNRRVVINFPDYKGKMGAGYIDAYKMLLQIEGTPFIMVQTNTKSQVSLAPIFGGGVEMLALSGIKISNEDKEAIGLTSCTYEGGSLLIECTKAGSATVTVTLLVGGDNPSDSTKPLPITISKSFVVIAKEAVASNNGWL